MNFFKVCLIIFFLATTLFAKTYTIDKSNSTASYTVTKLKDESVVGIFNNLTGSFIFDEKNKKLKSLKGQILVSSINTTKPQFDDFIKSNNILDEKKFPKIYFKSTKIVGNTIYGDLRIKNVVKNIELELELVRVSNKKIVLKLKGETKRSYFDLSWDELLDNESVLVSDEIKILIDVSGKPQYTQKKK